MKELKKENEKVVRLYSYKTKEEMLPKLFSSSILFSGTKQELLQKDNEWCAEIVDS